MSLAMKSRQCLQQQQGRPGGSRRTVSARVEILMKSAALRTVLLVLVFCGTVLSAPDLFARTRSSAGTPSDLDAAEFLQARDEGGYVDMDEDGEGDYFVDEDGDGIDDRRTRRHQKRNRQRWGDEQERGNVSGDGGQGSGGSKGYGAGAGPGPGPGGGGR